MSRIAKKPIVIAPGVTVTLVDSLLSVKGPLGTISKKVPTNVNFEIKDNTITLSINDSTKESKSLWGTWASHIRNMMQGVQKVFEKKAIVEGIGYKSDVKGSEIVFSLGFSHQINLAIPAGIKVTTEKGGVIIVSGINVEDVTAFISKIRSLKKPEPYKGKGIHYADEIIRRKQGKKAV